MRELRGAHEQASQHKQHGNDAIGEAYKVMLGKQCNKGKHNRDDCTAHHEKHGMKHRHVEVAKSRDDVGKTLDKAHGCAGHESSSEHALGAGEQAVLANRLGPCRALQGRRAQHEGRGEPGEDNNDG